MVLVGGADRQLRDVSPPSTTPLRNRSGRLKLQPRNFVIMPREGRESAQAVCLRIEGRDELAKTSSIVTARRSLFDFMAA